MRDALQNYENAKAAEQSALASLHEAIRQARADGETIADIMQATGYSRRRVFQILSDPS